MQRGSEMRTPQFLSHANQNIYHTFQSRSSCSMHCQCHTRCTKCQCSLRSSRRRRTLQAAGTRCLPDRQRHLGMSVAAGTSVCLQSYPQFASSLLLTPIRGNCFRRFHRKSLPLGKADNRRMGPSNSCADTACSKWRTPMNTSYQGISCSPRFLFRWRTCRPRRLCTKSCQVRCICPLGS